MKWMTTGLAYISVPLHSRWASVTPVFHSHLKWAFDLIVSAPDYWLDLNKNYSLQLHISAFYPRCGVGNFSFKRVLRSDQGPDLVVLDLLNFLHSIICSKRYLKTTFTSSRSKSNIYHSTISVSSGSSSFKNGPKSLALFRRVLIWSRRAVTYPSYPTFAFPVADQMDPQIEPRSLAR